MARLTPANAAGLLFDFVLWVTQARIDHMALVDILRERGVEVVRLHEMPEDVRSWPDARVKDSSMGAGLSDDLHARLTEMPAKLLFPYPDRWQEPGRAANPPGGDVSPSVTAAS